MGVTPFAASVTAHTAVLVVMKSTLPPAAEAEVHSTW